MKYYKGFDKYLKCYNGFQYEVGKTYDTGYIKELSEDDLCTNHVFHFCDSVENVNKYYLLLKKEKNRLCEVEPLGNIISDGKKFGTNKLKIVREITGNEFDYLTGNGTNEDLVKRFHELYAENKIEFLNKAQVGCKYNFADGKGSVISPDQWVDDCDNFHEGYVVVKLNERYNFIGKDGKIVSDQWFDWCNYFSEGYAKVKLNGKFNFIGTDGKLLSDRWFDWCNYFSEGYAEVELNDKFNFIGKDGKGAQVGKGVRYISDQWFDWCNDFSEGYAEVKLNEKYNLIGKDGKYLSDQWFEICGAFCRGYARIRLNNKWNFIGTDGKLLSNQWFDYCVGFTDGYAKAKLDGKMNFIGTDGRIFIP